MLSFTPSLTFSASFRVSAVRGSLSTTPSNTVDVRYSVSRRLYNPASRVTLRDNTAHPNMTDLSIGSPETMDADGVNAARAIFKSTFGAEPQIAAAAPGRVNLIGEHTDYNHGFVFPFALQRSTYIVASPLDPDAVACEVVSASFGNEVVTFDHSDTHSTDIRPEWLRYLKGMTAVYANNGYKVVPFRAAIVSSVPSGAGLSSSAALEMSTAVILEALGGYTVDPVARAKMGQTCEHKFVGVPCGIMDQLISSCGRAGHALLVDCRDPETNELIPLDHPDAVIVVANSKKAHKLSGSEYPERRAQCFKAAGAMRDALPDRNISHLRDCDMQMLDNIRPSIDDVTYQRAYHVITEDERTHKAKESLVNGNLEAVGEQMYKSHESLRDYFHVSTPQLNALVDIARSVDGVYGSRLTGAGFGGCTVTLVHKDSVAKLMEAFRERYPTANEGVEPDVFFTQAGDGARLLSHLLTTA